ncbi:hypothetical protein COBT_003429 [Conglomerata obtusa]
MNLPNNIVSIKIKNNATSNDLIDLQQRTPDLFDTLLDNFEHAEKNSIEFSNHQNTIKISGFNYIKVRNKKKKRAKLQKSAIPNQASLKNFEDKNEMQNDEVEIEIAKTNIDSTTEVLYKTNELNPFERVTNTLNEHIIQVLEAKNNTSNIQSKLMIKKLSIGNINNVPMTKNITDEQTECKESKKVFENHKSNFYDETEFQKNTKHTNFINIDYNLNDKKTNTSTNKIPNLSCNNKEIINKLHKKDKTFKKTEIDSEYIEHKPDKNNNREKSLITSIKFNNEQEQNKTQDNRPVRNKNKKMKYKIISNEKIFSKKHTKEFDDQIYNHNKNEYRINKKIKPNENNELVIYKEKHEIYDSIVVSNSKNEFYAKKVDQNTSISKIYAYKRNEKFFIIEICTKVISLNEFLYLHLSNNEIIPLVPLLYDKPRLIPYNNHKKNDNTKNNCLSHQCSKNGLHIKCGEFFFGIEAPKLLELEFFTDLNLNKTKLLCSIHEVSIQSLFS